MAGYAYAAGNPITNADPTGLCPSIACSGVPQPGPPGHRHIQRPYGCGACGGSSGGSAPGGGSNPGTGGSGGPPGSSVLPPAARPAYAHFMTTWQPGYGDVGPRGILSSLDDFCGNDINLCGSQLTATIWGMVAGISAVGSAGSASQRLLGRLEAAEETTPAVIGEGMISRVVPYAEAHGYVYYSGVENRENFTAEERLAHNLAQVEAWKAEGRPVIDIGPEPGRAFYPMATSPIYAMEQNSLRGYAGYSTDILPGEADWWIASAP